MHPNGFRHEILPYAGGRDGFVRSVSPLLRRALDAGSPVLVAVRPELIDPLREDLGDDAGRVQFRNMRELAGNPARIIPEWESFLDGQEAHGSRGALGVGEPALGIGEPVWPGRRAVEIEECAIHEQLLDHAFSGRASWSLVCPYDLDGLEDEVIETAQRSHAFAYADGVSSANSRFVEGTGRPALSGTLPPPACGPVYTMDFREADLARVRRFVAACAERGHLGEDARGDLVLAVSELAANSVQYGGGGGRCRVWSEGDMMLCEVSDSGHITSPLVGRVRPTPEQIGGRGLWVVNQLCELVQIRSGEDGTVVRIHAHAG